MEAKNYTRLSPIFAFREDMKTRGDGNKDNFPIENVIGIKCRNLIQNDAASSRRSVFIFKLPYRAIYEGNFYPNEIVPRRNIFILRYFIFPGISLWNCWRFEFFNQDFPKRLLPWPPQQTTNGTMRSICDLHWTHFFIRQAHDSQATIWLHGLNNTDAFLYEHTIHSSIWKSNVSINVLYICYVSGKNI